MSKVKIKNNINDVIVNYIQYCDYKNLSDKTIKSYYQTLLLFSKYLEEELQITDIRKVNKKVVEDYLTFTKERGKYSFSSSEEGIIKANINKRSDVGKEISNSTLNGYLRNIKAFITYCEESCIITHTEISKIKPIKVTHSERGQITDSEYKKLIRALDLSKFHEFRDYVIINLLFDTGMRLSECLSLTLYDVDLLRRSIFLSADVTKGRKDRVVFFSDKMTSLLRRWIRFKDVLVDSDLLFPTQRTNRKIEPSNFERNFRTYLSRAKINKKITPHGLRNNFARRFLMSGGDIFILSKLLGHSSVTVTEKAYLDVSSEDIRRKYQQYSPLSNMD